MPIQEGRGFMQGEKPSGVSRCGVGPDEPQAMSASGRGFESPLPHHSRTSLNSALTSEIVGYGFWMRKEGYSETTIKRYVRLLKELAKHGDLCDPESIKIGLTRTGWAYGTQRDGMWSGDVSLNWGSWKRIR